MVMRLPMPPHCSVTLVRHVVLERQNGVNAQYFNGIHAVWESKVQEYIRYCGSPEHLLPWAEIPRERNKSFLNLYLSPKADSAQFLVLKDLNDHSLNVCPACGEFGRPNTLDHYLPKGKYPHFCITPVNLFPMCDRCQKEKLEKTGDEAQPRFFLHPYFDTFVAQQVVRIIIDPPYKSPSFRIEFSDWLSADQLAVVTSHVRELAIEERFAHFFKDESIRIQKLAASMRVSGLSIEQVIRGFEISYQAPSLNTWQHLYYAAVLDNAEMIEYLSRGELPDDL